MRMNKLFDLPIFQPRIVFLISLLVSIAALSAALIAQFVFDLKPCILCLYTRIPYVVLIILSAVALLRPEKEYNLFLILIWLAYAAAFAIGLFHIGVEQHWWELSGGCPVQKLGDKSPEQALAELLTTPLVPCDKVGWKIFDVSVVIWNAALALGMNDYLVLAWAIHNKKKSLQK